MNSDREQGDPDKAQEIINALSEELTATNSGLIALTLELEQTQLERQWAEERFRRIFEQAVEGIFQTSLDNRYTLANPALAHILGYTSPEELTAAIADIDNQVYVDCNRREQFKQHITQDGIVLGWEAEVYRRDGEVIWIVENACILRDPSERVLGIEGMLTNITQRKSIEAAERETERLRVLTQTAGAAAHEINQPLTILLGRTELLLIAETTDDFARIQLAEIHRAVRRINEIVKQMTTIRQYATKSYGRDCEIVDLQSAAGNGQ